MVFVGLYVLLALLPLVVAKIGAPASRGFWIEFGVGLGFVGLAMLGLQFALTARFRRIAGELGQDTMLQFHRQAAMVAFAFVLAHPLVLFIAEPGFIEFLDPRANLPRAVALMLVTILLVAIIVTTLWRAALRIPYDWWRLGHAVMATLILIIGLAHVMRVGHYVDVPWKKAFWVIMVGGSFALLLQMRVLKPLLLRRRPYVVDEVRRETTNSWTLTLRPVGHEAMRFTPGQFAWLTLGGSPFAFQQHPFSFSSSARDRSRIEFTIKELGDYTAGIGSIPVGARAHIDGPYGAFILDDQAPQGVFIVGGIGITPIMSILRTLRDRGDRRPLLLLYANVDEQAIVFREELDRLSSSLDLRVIHILEKPPQGWKGEIGRITPEIIDRCLPDRREDAQYLICGPDPMMDLVESTLLSRGIPLRNILSERFNIA